MPEAAEGPARRWRGGAPADGRRSGRPVGEPGSPLGTRYAAWVQRRRWWVVGAWAVVLASLTLFAPPFGSTGDEVDSIIPLDSPALRAELRAVDEFGYPLTSRVAVVQRDPAGLSPFTASAGVLEALSVNQHPQRPPLLGALPVTNVVPLVPGAAERGTAVLTYLFTDPTSSLASQHEAARRYVREHLDRPGDAVVGIAGSVPARAEQAGLVTRNLPLLEGLTVAAILLLVGLTFRSVVAPLLALAAAGVALLVTLRLTGLAGAVLGLAVPAELEPLLVALLLGVVTDYTIFYVSALQDGVRAGAGWHAAVRQAVTSFTPIVLAAGLTVAAGTASLLAAKSGFFRALGPAMALAVLVGLAVSVTLVPALIAILRSRTFWPRRVPAVAGATAAGSPVPAVRTRFAWFVEHLTRPRVAAVVLVGCTGLLVLASLPLRHIALGVGFTQSLPASNPVREASRQAGAAFAPGITSPTVLLVEGRGVTAQGPALERLQRAVADQPGVAGVFGPAQNVPDIPAGVVLSRDGGAARMVVVLENDPLEASAISDVSRLRERLPGLVERSGLQDARAALGGDTALAEGLVSSTSSDLWRVGLAAIAVNLLLLVMFLRALVAPLYLLACSVLALTATLGLVTWVFQDLLGNDGITFYVPFAAAVLLVALGSDYNIFGVGHVWREARRRPLREAVVVAMPQTTRAISAAALTLAVSFGLLALIPLRPFRELALAMAVGILVDGLVVRSVLVPCLLTLVGRASSWPGRHLGPEVDGDPQPEPVLPGSSTRPS